MYVGVFLKQRTAFIRQFYAAASFSFVERKRKIEAGEEPFVPPYSEDGEPPFIDEWIEADDSLHVLGYSCISMLAAALHLYMMEWEKEFGIPVEGSIKSGFKKGWMNGYRGYFAAHTGIHFENGPANQAVLEEVVLARNQVQHPNDNLSHRVRYSNIDIKKRPHAFFIADLDKSLLADLDKAEKSWLLPPTLHITEEKLSAAISEVEKFVDWLDVQIEIHVYKRPSP